MRIKSFFAESIEAAMAEAGKELGAEAMLMNSRRTEPELRHLGSYEVVCAVAPGAKAADTPQTPAPIPAKTPASPADEAGITGGAAGLTAAALAREMSRLREQMESLARLIGGSGGLFSSGLSSGMPSRPELSQIYDALCDSGLSTDLAQDIVLRLSLQLAPTDSPRDAARLARSELASFILTDPTLGSGGTRMIALIGPPGSGKTTSLIKLAIRECLALRRPCSLFTIDTVRIAAADQLRSYATILGVPFQVIETPAALSQVLENLRPNDTAFIDTPGLAATDMEDATSWAEAFAAHEGLDVHLVLPASMRATDQERIAGQYEIFSPRKLLFTKLDETEAVGGIINLSLALRKPISFLSCGQQIPEDLERAAAGQIADQVLHELAGGETESAGAAAA